MNHIGGKEPVEDIFVHKVIKYIHIFKGNDYLYYLLQKMQSYYKI